MKTEFTLRYIVSSSILFISIVIILWYLFCAFVNRQ